MKSVEEWYNQWSISSKAIVDEINESKKQKTENLKTKIIKNKNSYITAVYKKYACNETKSIVDISYIYDKVTDGVGLLRLTNKEPKSNNKDIIYEYGFNEKNECIYRKNRNTDKIDRLYIYNENQIYELEVTNIENTDPLQITVGILGEYIFGKNRLPTEVFRNYGILNYEHYNWVSENICIIDCGIKNYILIRDSLGVIAVYQNISQVNFDKLFSYNSQNYVNLQRDITLEEKLLFDKIYIRYSRIKDIKGKLTEYRLIDIYGKRYLVSEEYMRASKSFSYKRAKEVYKNEILEFIKRKIKIINFEVKFINIQYFNYGYSIMDIVIGFDEVYCEDIHSMKVIEDLNFSHENSDLIMTMNNYINDKMYYGSFKKMMELIKKDIEEKYCIKVLLVEISD